MSTRLYTFLPINYYFIFSNLYVQSVVHLVWFSHGFGSLEHSKKWNCKNGNFVLLSRNEGKTLRLHRNSHSSERPKKKKKKWCITNQQYQIHVDCHLNCIILLIEMIEYCKSDAIKTMILKPSGRIRCYRLWELSNEEKRKLQKIHIVDLLTSGIGLHFYACKIARVMKIVEWESWIGIRYTLSMSFMCDKWQKCNERWQPKSFSLV